MVAAAYTNAVADATNPTITWNPNTDPGQSRAVLQGVTSASSTVTAATSAIAADIGLDQSGTNGNGVTLTLGNGNQTFSPAATGGLQTTAGNDTIRGVSGGVAPGTAGASELTTSDSLNGGGGLNILNTVLDNEATLDPVLVNMQQLNLAPGAANQTFSALSSTGLALVTLAGGISGPGDGEVLNTSFSVVGIPTSVYVGMANAVNIADSLFVSFTNLGSGDNLATLALDNNAGGGTFDTQVVNGFGVNTLDVDSSGTTASQLTLGGNDTQLTSVVIRAVGSFSLSNNNTGVTDFNGIEATGNLTIVTGALTVRSSITGGSGNDTLNASAATRPVTMLDGNGVDTLIFNGSVPGNAISVGSGNDTILTGGTTGLSFITDVDASSNSQLVNDVNVLSNFSANQTIDLKGLAGAGYSVDTTINATSLVNALSTSQTLLQAVNAVALLVSNQGLNKQVVAFAFSGNEYIYQDTAGNGVVSPGDGLMQVTGAATTFKASDLTLA
jgi:hypothetical protein